MAWASEESSDMDCDALEPSPSSLSKPQISVTSVLCASMFTVSPSDFLLSFQPLPVESPEFQSLRPFSSAAIPGECHLVSGHLVSSKHR